jgi:hypothetical protein
MIKTTERKFTSKQLQRRLPEEHQHRLYLVRNSPRGIILDETRESWGDLGYKGDARRNRSAIEVRARNGRVIAAVAWWYSPKRKCVSTLGTYVSKTLRRRGLATALWRAMLTTTRVKIVYSEPVTDEGLTLVNSLREKLQGEVRIRTIDNADTAFLEDLRARKRKAA